MYTPEEAIEELEFAVEAARLQGRDGGRPDAAAACRRSPRSSPEASKLVEWYDVDRPRQRPTTTTRCGRSAASCSIAPSFHNGARSILLRNSPSNFCYNHIGHFASAGHAVAKALFFGGVTRRFPDLNFAFLEGGVGWACMLYADLIGHWEKRNRQALESTNPSKLDRGRLLELAQKYGQPGGGRGGAPRRGAGGRLELHADRRRRGPRRLLPLQDRAQGGHPRPLRAALLLRLRGRRSDQRLGLQPQGQPDGRAAQRALQLGHRPLRRARHDRGRARGLRAGRARADRRRRLPRLHVRQRRALLGRGEPGLLQGHRGREAGGRGAAPPPGGSHADRRFPDPHLAERQDERAPSPDPDLFGRRCAGRDGLGRGRLRGDPSAQLARRGGQRARRRGGAPAPGQVLHPRALRPPEPGSREASSPTGASGRACSGSGSPSTSRIRRRGGPTARSTGSGRPARRRDCPSGSWPGREHGGAGEDRRAASRV